MRPTAVSADSAGLGAGAGLRGAWARVEAAAIQRDRYWGLTAMGRSLELGLAPLLARDARGVLLDAGAGRLAHRRAVARLPRVARYVSLDVERTHRGLDTLGDLVRGLPFPDWTFDSVLCSQVLEHVPDPVAAVHEIARVLRPGGTLILSVPHLSFVHGAPHDYQRFTVYGARQLLLAAGIEPVEVVWAGSLPSLVATPASMALLLATDRRGLRRLGGGLNRCLVEAAMALDRWLDRSGLFALNVIAIGRKPAAGGSG